MINVVVVYIDSAVIDIAGQSEKKRVGISYGPTHAARRQDFGIIVLHPFLKRQYYWI